MKRTISRRTLLKTGCTATAGLTLSGTAISRSAVESQTTDSGLPVEWRNRQTGMSYRRLGRTGYMVSEFVMGGNTISPTNNKHVELAVEMGLNYFDTSPAYGNGNSEKGYGELLKRSYFREKVFVNSKVSIFDSKRNEFYWYLYQDLGDDGKKKIEHEVNEIIKRRNIKNSRYMGRYGTWQHSEIMKSNFSNVMERHYGNRINRREQYYNRVIRSVEESLKRLKTDYLDLYMCPHGANTPEEVLISEMHDALKKLKKDGKIRAFGFSAHNDPGGVLSAALKTGFYDAVMIAYNVVNADFCEIAVREAYENDIGVIAMKAARPVYTGRKPKIWVPPSRLKKLNHMIPERMKTPLKAYLWVLQNPHITCVNSEMITEEHVLDNLPLAGKKVELVPLEDQEKFAY